MTAAQRSDCPHCDPEHRDPASRPWNVCVGPERDADGQPVYLHALPANGAHVAESDAAWLWQLIRDAQTSEPPQTVQLPVQRIPQGHAYAFHCAVCNARAPWRIDRYGDAVVSWACNPHLAQECAHLQRDWEATTRLEVTPNRVHQDCDCPPTCDCGKCQP